MKLQSEINYTAEFEAWTGDTITKDSVENAIMTLNLVFPELKAELKINKDNFIEKGYDLKLRLKITGGKE